MTMVYLLGVLAVLGLVLAYKIDLITLGLKSATPPPNGSAFDTAKFKREKIAANSVAEASKAKVRVPGFGKR